MFSYNFEYPEVATLNEEYYVISFLSLIGWVGGTMGMFFGFSFSGALSTILDFFEMICLKISDNGTIHILYFFNQKLLITLCRKEAKD